MNKEIKIYFEGLSSSEKDKIKNRMKIIFDDCISRGFTIGMVEVFGEMLKDQARKLL